MNNQQKHQHGGRRVHAGRPSRAPIAKRVNFKASTVQWLAATGPLGPEVRRIVEAAQEATEAAHGGVINYNEYVRICDCGDYVR